MDTCVQPPRHNSQCYEISSLEKAINADPLPWSLLGEEEERVIDSVLNGNKWLLT